uniref:Uncharacterized protein n=1 Tax=Romanomermis culicivorax TaxID=13658 RepID=A0A915L2M4_ROMCU
MLQQVAMKYKGLCTVFFMKVEGTAFHFIWPISGGWKIFRFFFEVEGLKNHTFANVVTADISYVICNRPKSEFGEKASE